MLTRLCHSLILVNSVLTGSGSKTRHHANSIYPDFPQQSELESDKEKKGNEQRHLAVVHGVRLLNLGGAVANKQLVPLSMSMAIAFSSPKSGCPNLDFKHMCECSTDGEA